MLGKLYNFAAIGAIATVLSLGSFAGLLWGTGRLSSAQLSQIAAVLRGTESAEPVAETPTDTTDPNAPPEEIRRQSADEVRALRQDDHLERLEIERGLADLEAQRRMLDQVMQRVVEDQDGLVADRQRFEQARNAASQKLLDEGFKRELNIVKNLKAEQAKEHILRLWKSAPNDAIRLLCGMDEREVKRIFEQLKTPEELDIQTDLLEQIRLQGMQGYAKSGTTGDTQR